MRKPVGRPRTTWQRTIDDDLQSLNFGVHTAWRKARDRDVWQRSSLEFADIVSVSKHQAIMRVYSHMIILLTLSL